METFEKPKYTIQIKGINMSYNHGKTFWEAWGTIRVDSSPIYCTAKFKVWKKKDRITPDLEVSDAMIWGNKSQAQRDFLAVQIKGDVKLHVLQAVRTVAPKI